MGNDFTPFTLSIRQKWMISVLVCILSITGSRIDMVLAAVSINQTKIETVHDNEIGLQITPSYFGSLEVADKIKAVGSRVVEMTAYNSEVGQTDATPFITANGTRVRDGIVAANFLKFNTRIRLPDLYGDRIFIVTDRMNQRFNNRIDIWMEKKSDALAFGIKRGIKVEILKDI